MKDEFGDALSHPLEIRASCGGKEKQPRIFTEKGTDCHETGFYECFVPRVS